MAIHRNGDAGPAGSNPFRRLYTAMVDASAAETAESYPILP